MLEEVRPKDVMARQSHGEATSTADATLSRLRGTAARMFGEQTLDDVRASLRRPGGVMRMFRRVFTGVGPHTVGNFGPDVFCTGACDLARVRMRFLVHLPHAQHVCETLLLTPACYTLVAMSACVD